MCTTARVNLEVRSDGDQELLCQLIVTDVKSVVCHHREHAMDRMGILHNKIGGAIRKILIHWLIYWLAGWLSHIVHFTVMATPTVELVARLPEEQLNGKSKIDHIGSTSGKFTLPPPIRGRDQLQAMLHRQWLHKVSLSLFPASKCIEIMASLLLLCVRTCVCVCVFIYLFIFILFLISPPPQIHHGFSSSVLCMTYSPEHFYFGFKPHRPSLCSFFKVLPQIPTMSYPVRISCCWCWQECVEGIFCCGIWALLSFGFPVLLLPLIFNAHCWPDRSMVLTQSLQSGSYFVRVATIVKFFWIVSTHLKISFSKLSASAWCNFLSRSGDFM